MARSDGLKLWATCRHCGKHWWLDLQPPPSGCPGDAEVVLELIDPTVPFSSIYDKPTKEKENAS